MNKRVLLLFLFLIKGFSGATQTPFSGDPDSSLFLTRDIGHFWQAFDLFVKDTTANPFGTHYIEVGSEGVKGFTPFRIRSADHLYNMVKRRKADYEGVRENTLRIHEKEKQCRSAFYALKYWYPEAVYPPVYFVIGAYNSGGTFNRNGLFIGAEMQKDIDNIPHIVAHELVHFQQKNWVNNPNLLRQSLVEGSADFIGELISGKHINPAAQSYGESHRKTCAGNSLPGWTVRISRTGFMGSPGRTTGPMTWDTGWGIKSHRDFLINRPIRKKQSGIFWILRTRWFL